MSTAKAAGKVRLYMSMSVDGFITGPDYRPGHGLGGPPGHVELELLRSLQGSDALHLRCRVLAGG